jgi:hypothetical protein
MKMKPECFNERRSVGDDEVGRQPDATGAGGNKSIAHDCHAASSAHLVGLELIQHAAKRRMLPVLHLDLVR